MLPSETMIWQPEFTDKTLSRKPGAVHYSRNSERTFENQHDNLLYWTYTSPDKYEAVSSLIQ
ncbi:hypothetical protein EsCd1HHP049_01966 [Escherichia sp. HH154_1D]|nr:hypothetical protein EsCdI10290_02115 [Escherichia sp. 10290]BDI46234.1 hypothetical protein EsCd1HHP049_01966 [Escherichia sp. HH154_1D]